MQNWRVVDTVPDHKRYMLTVYESPYDGNQIRLFLEERETPGILTSIRGGHLDYVQTLEPEARELLAWVREHGRVDGFFLTSQPGHYDLTQEAGDRLAAYMQKVNSI